MAEQEQEVTIEGLVIQDLANTNASVTVDRSVWRARALKAEQALEELNATLAESGLEVEKDKEGDG